MMARTPMAEPIQQERKKLPKLMLWFVLALAALYIIDSQTQGRVTPEELAAWVKSGEPITIIDVRSEGEYRQGHVPGAIHMPFTRALSRAAELDDLPRPFVVY